jgi:hypothetical protein
VTDARIYAPEEPRPPSRRVGLAPTGKAPPCHGARGFRTFAGTRSDDKLAQQVDCFEAKARPSPSWRACDSLAASVLNVWSRSKYRWRSPCCGRGAARNGRSLRNGQCVHGRTKSNFISRLAVSLLLHQSPPWSILRPALRAPQPLVPLRYRRRGTVAFGHCSGVGLDLMTAFLAPHDKARTRRGGVDERRRRTGGGRHRPGRRSVEWRGPLNRSLLPSF